MKSGKVSKKSGKGKCKDCESKSSLDKKAGLGSNKGSQGKLGMTRHL